ncbi:MAG: hypothetical protein CME60_00625 [Halobacteriovoraceae bacterium]|nr:hypothetical protein [Halobacteriovoraceae bacterium]
MLTIGEKNRKIFFLSSLLAIFLSSTSFAALTSPSKLHKKIALEKRKLSSITREISTFEKKLERTNQEYLKINDRKNGLEKELYSLKKRVYDSLSNLTEEKKKIKNILSTYVVNMMGKEQEASDLLTQKVLMTSLKKEMKFYDSQIVKTEAVKINLSAVEKSLAKYTNEQNVLLDVISTLEKEKNKNAENYLNTKKNYEKYMAQWQKVKVKKTRTSKTGALRSQLGTFKPPLQKHTKLDFKKKGVTFFFDQKTLPVLAPRSGKVIHNGSLAPYGNVIMIDHGKETISVCFGDFGPKVKKGMKVKVGQVIGYTSRKNRREGKLYFEVRKKDKAQPTIHLLDDKALASTGNYTTKS